MTELDVDKDDVVLACAEAERIGALKRSILLGKGNKTGILGELSVARYFGNDVAIRASTYDYDILIDGMKFDVKTKRRTVVAKPEYNAAIPEYQLKQKCDYYLFVSLRIAGGLPAGITLCGWISKDDFVKKSKLVHAGSRDASNDWYCSMDCLVLPYRDLLPIEDLKK
jgi:hypothetical protein